MLQPGEAQPPRVSGAQPACKKRRPRSSFIYCNNTNFEARHDVLWHAIPSSALCIRARALHNFPYNSTHIELPPQEPLHDLDLRHAGADLQDLLPKQSHLVLVQDINFEDCGKHIRRICGGTARAGQSSGEEWMERFIAGSPNVCKEPGVVVSEDGTESGLFPSPVCGIASLAAHVPL